METWTMSDTPSSPAGSSSSTPPSIPGPMSSPAGSGEAGGPQLSEKEIADGKAFAILSYAINFVGIPFWLVPLIMRNNEFSLYHSKQCLLMWLVAVATGVVAIVPCAGWIIAVVVLLGLLVFNVMGLINAVNGKSKALPLIGGLAEKWFAGIRKVPGAV